MAKSPHHSQAHANLAKALLTLGDHERGWRENEWRLLTPPDNPDQLPAGLPPLELGARVERLLLWREQGVGDEVMFCALLPAARRLASTLQVRVDERLVPLLKRSFPEMGIAASGKRREPIASLEDQWDAQLALGSLPLHLDPRWEGAAQQGSAFLRAEPTRSQQPRRELAPPDGFLCGISWRSEGWRGQEKSIALATMAEALALPGVRLVSLQYGDCAAEIKVLAPRSEGPMGALVLPPPASVDPTEDLDGLAALIAACDLVISISNTTAHLAGGLGVPTWVLVRPVPDWRWGMEGDRCRWYDSVRIFRQREGEGWPPVLEQVREALRQKLALIAPPAA